MYTGRCKRHLSTCLFTFVASSPGRPQGIAFVLRTPFPVETHIEGRGRKLLLIGDFVCKRAEARSCCRPYRAVDKLQRSRRASPEACFNRRYLFYYVPAPSLAPILSCNSPLLSCAQFSLFPFLTHLVHAYVHAALRRQICPSQESNKS